MELIWYVLLGLFFAAYFALGGYNYGVGMLLVGGRGAGPSADARTAKASTDTRRDRLTAVGPFFLGNEVWLVAAAGILIGAFPMLEGELLSGLYPAVLVALTGVILVTAGIPMRSRYGSAAARTRFDRLVAVGGALAAGGWGAVLGGLLQGVPLRPDGQLDGVSHVFTPFVAAAAVTMAGLMAVHGAAFLALRLPAGPATRIAAAGRRMVPAVLVAVAAATLLGLLSDRVRHAVQQPAVALLLPLLLAGALLIARGALTRSRPGWAFAATTSALALPVLLVGATTWPYALISSVDPTASLTVNSATADAATLRLLGWLLAAFLPALLGFQAMCWWVFRGRVDKRTPVYW